MCQVGRLTSDLAETLGRTSTRLVRALPRAETPIFIAAPRQLQQTTFSRAMCPIGSEMRREFISRRCAHTPPAGKFETPRGTAARATGGGMEYKILL